MGLTRADLKDKRWSEQEKKRIEVFLKDYIRNDEWAFNRLKNIGILLTSHPGNRAYLRACIDSHRKLGYWITLAYDNYIHPDSDTVDYNSIMPPKDVMDYVSTFIMPHYQTWGGVLYPYFWLMKLGANSMRDFEYIYCANGDMVLEKPEGFPKLLELMGNADIMGTGPDTDRKFNTAGFIVKSEALIAIVEHIQERLVPFEVYEKWTQEVGNTEGRFGLAIKDLGLKKIELDPPSTEQLHIKGTGTWYDLVGFRHIHSEMNWAYRNRGIPPELKYLDERYLGEHNKKYLKLYEQTGDINVLKDWWAK